MSLNCSMFTSISLKHMSREIMISLLRRGNTGAQILEILDSIVADTDNTEPATFNSEPTLHELEF